MRALRIQVWGLLGFQLVNAIDIPLIVTKSVTETKFVTRTTSFAIEISGEHTEDERDPKSNKQIPNEKVANGVEKNYIYEALSEMFGADKDNHKRSFIFEWDYFHGKPKLYDLSSTNPFQKTQLFDIGPMRVAQDYFEVVHIFVYGDQLTWLSGNVRFNYGYVHSLIPKLAYDIIITALQKTNSSLQISESIDCDIRKTLKLPEISFQFGKEALLSLQTVNYFFRDPTDKSICYLAVKINEGSDDWIIGATLAMTYATVFRMPSQDRESHEFTISPYS